MSVVVGVYKLISWIEDVRHIEASSSIDSAVHILSYSPGPFPSIVVDNQRRQKHITVILASANHSIPSQA